MAALIECEGRGEVEDGRGNAGAVEIDQPKQLLAIDLCARDYLAGAFGAASAAEALAEGDAFLAWLGAQTAGDLEQLAEQRKSYREDATKNAELADLDPEAAAKKKDDELVGDGEPRVCPPFVGDMVDRVSVPFEWLFRSTIPRPVSNSGFWSCSRRWSMRASSASASACTRSPSR